MNSEMIMKEYHRWVDRAAEDSEIKEELNNIADDYEKIEDAFYRNLEFGTGGLRGVIGAGTNRMNIHTVARASQGLARYVNKQGYKTASIAISYDSRIKSKLFARIASEVFVGNGIRVYIYDRLMPTPCLSFAVRQLKCAAGIMITASHNPAQYNGYKVYGPDGCQITTVVASEILDEIEAIDIFEGICRSDFDESIAAGSINYIVPEIVTGFIEAVKSQSVLGSNDVVDKNVSIVYSPLNGTGLEPVLRTLNESGFTNIIVVKEQEQPDGHFPTCPYPNPEIQDAMSLGIGYARKYNADLLLATDPDCDRIGIAVKDADGKYVLLSGNETGMLLLDYICSRRNANGTMPERPVFFKTIVTIDMGEQIGLLESKGQGERYIFGFEESYGYLSGSYVRDKDAVGGALLICEMFAYYKSKGIGLWEKMQELYRTYGYCLNTLHTFEFEGAAGFKRMQEIMAFMREGIDNIGGIKVVDCMDYSKGLDGLPKSNVLKFLLADHCSAVIRPSGTEPKIKVYMSVSAGDMEAAARIEKKMQESIIDFLEFKIF